MSVARAWDVGQCGLTLNFSDCKVVRQKLFLCGTPHEDDELLALLAGALRAEQRAPRRDHPGALANDRHQRRHGLESRAA